MNPQRPVPPDPEVDSLKAQVHALRQELDAIHTDAFHWLLATGTPPPQPFAFAQPAQAGLVSVVIPAYRSAAFLDRCVRSVWQQAPFAGTIEVLLCEDGSPDDTHARAVALQRQSPMPMQVLTHPGRVNRGVSATRNLGLRHARGSLIALLDADDVWLPERLAVQVDYLARHPEVQCVCSFGYNRDLDGKPVPGWNSNPIAGDYRGVPPPNDVQAPYTFDALLKIDPVVNSTLLIRRQAIAAAGGYPEIMAHQAEDWLLLAKLSLQAPIALIEQPLIDYTIHPDSYSTQYFTQQLAYGVQIEFLFHLVHWMVQHPLHRERGMALFRKGYPKLLAAHTNVGLLLEEYFRGKSEIRNPKSEGNPKHQIQNSNEGRIGPPERGTCFAFRASDLGFPSDFGFQISDFESYLAELFAEVTKLRRFKKRIQNWLAPLYWIPGMHRTLQAVWRYPIHAAQRRRSA